MIQEYLDTLVKEASDQKTEQAFMENVSVAELAKAAGIKLAQNVCPRCANHMEKRASVYYCSCGMMKKAMHEPGHEEGKPKKKGLPPELAARAAKVKAVQDPTKPGAETPAEGLKEAGLSEVLVNVGDAAGRMLAKSAAVARAPSPLPLEEIQESIQEARARENVPGRGRRAAFGGAVGGGLAGGAALGGLGMLARKRFGLVAPLAGAGIGAIGGGALGARLGRGHGEEEARADRAVSMLRALKAHRAGMTRGLRTGVIYGSQMRKQGSRNPFARGR